MANTTFLQRLRPRRHDFQVTALSTSTVRPLPHRNDFRTTAPSPCPVPVHSSVIVALTTIFGPPPRPLAPSRCVVLVTAPLEKNKKFWTTVPFRGAVGQQQGEGNQEITQKMCVEKIMCGNYQMSVAITGPFHVIAPGIHHCGSADLLLRERAGELRRAEKMSPRILTPNFGSQVAKTHPTYTHLVPGYRSRLGGRNLTTHHNP